MRHTIRGWLRLKLVFPTTILALLITFVSLAVYRIFDETRPVREAFLGMAAGLTGVLLIDLVMTIYEEWQAWPWLFTRLRAWRRNEIGVARPATHAATLFYPIHLADEYIGLTLAFGLLAMGAWVLDETSDKSRFFTGFDTVVTTRNMWEVWIIFVSTASFVGNGVGFVAFLPRHWAVFVVYWLNNVVLFLYVTLILNILLGWFFTKDHDELGDSHAHADLEQGQPYVQPTPQEFYAQQQQHGIEFVINETAVANAHHHPPRPQTYF